MHYEEYERRAAHYPPPPPSAGGRASPPPPPFYTSTHQQHPHSPVYYPTAPPPPPPPPAHYGGYPAPYGSGGYYDGPPAPSPFVGGSPAPPPPSAVAHHHHHAHHPAQAYEPKMMAATHLHHHQQQQQQHHHQQPFHTHPHPHHVAPVHHHAPPMHASSGPGPLITPPMSSGGDQQPTYVGYIKSSTDAILLLSACDLPSDANTTKSTSPPGGRGMTNALPPPRRVTRRLLDAERAELVASGSVFVWDEKEAGMKRWTDGRVWSASRVSGCFLTYRELEARKKTNPSSSLNGHPDGPTSNQYKPEGLIKQSFSITTASGRKLHVISYFTKRDVREGRLRRVSEDPRFVGEGGGEWGLQIDEAEYSFPDLGGGGSHDGQVAAQLGSQPPLPPQHQHQAQPPPQSQSPHAQLQAQPTQPDRQHYSAAAQHSGYQDDEVSLGSRSASPQYPAQSPSSKAYHNVPSAAPALASTTAAPSTSLKRSRDQAGEDDEDDDEDEDDEEHRRAERYTAQDGRPSSYFRAETNSTKRPPVRPRLARGRSNSMSASIGNSNNSHLGGAGSSSTATNDGRTSFQSNTSFATTVSTGEGQVRSTLAHHAARVCHSRQL
ncbi:hypothetical protein FA10DRAFT_260158 [Acaromyces ingoldii]|uniref:cAMP-independent regulatory protein pac2 n=1 Tax=Acaromyces ingoldii TaxID=215250 RepID=A0A316YM19_9BASI|nr:hypothetical protein FA10DRAFT_260158 [Acaromyces ingoldii]PWN90299.1 hypothetical protein FA10DRAFT_260158 [Acaromyces ingoldii]